MEREDYFFIAQYESLREEIKETKSRSFKTMTIGFTILPAAQAIGLKYTQISAVMIVIPLLVIAFATIYLSENHAIMRCGRFIRTCIEPSVTNVPGWECYLERDKHCQELHAKTRTVDAYAIYAFFGLFLIYYVGSSILAVLWWHEFAKTDFITAIFIVFYGSIGVSYGVFLNKNLRSANSTKAASSKETVLGSLWI